MGPRFRAVIVLYIVMEAGQPMVSSFLALVGYAGAPLRTADGTSVRLRVRLFAEGWLLSFRSRAPRGTVDTDNPNGHGYVEKKVPPNWNDSGPAEGALENIQRLKEQAAASAPAARHGFLRSLAWVWWIAVPAIIWWTIKKLFGRPSAPSSTDPDVEKQIARYRRSGFKDPRPKEIERRMRDYMAGRTTKF